MVVGALNRTASRYCLMLRTLVVFCYRQSNTNRICSLSSFRSLDFTTWAG